MGWWVGLLIVSFFLFVFLSFERKDDDDDDDEEDRQQENYIIIRSATFESHRCRRKQASPVVVLATGRGHGQSEHCV